MMILGKILPVLFSLIWLFQSQSVLVYNSKNGEVIEIYGHNKNYYPVTINMTLEPENMEVIQRRPYIAVMRAQERKVIFSLRPIDSSQRTGVKYTYSYAMGSIFAKHDDRYAYRLPFKKGESYRLDQGYGGEFSHTGESFYAVDFNMEEGTPVYAARNGLVVRVEESYNIGGSTPDFMEYANFITVLHDDGTFADYSHLQENGALVKEGQRVDIGQQIGISGSTGYSTGPHLHFVVKRARRSGAFESIPIKFSTKGGIVDQLIPGESYIAY